MRRAVIPCALCTQRCTCCPAVSWMLHVSALWFIHNSIFPEEHLDCLIIYLSYAQTFLLPLPCLSFPCAPVPRRACASLSPSPPQTHKIPALDIITWINAWTMALGKEWNEGNRVRRKDLGKILFSPFFFFFVRCLHFLLLVPPPLLNFFFCSPPKVKYLFAACDVLRRLAIIVFWICSHFELFLCFYFRSWDVFILWLPTLGLAWLIVATVSSFVFMINFQE